MHHCHCSSINTLYRLDFDILFLATKHYWKTAIEKHGGKVANSILGTI